MLVGRKVCSRCRQELEEQHYHKGKNVCKECRKPELANYKIKYPEKYKKQLENRRNERLRKYAQVYNNRLCRKCKEVKTGKHKWVCAKCKKENKSRLGKLWYRDNPLKAKEIKSRDYQKHKDNYRKLCNKWKKKNVEKQRAMDKRHSAKIVTSMNDNYIKTLLVRNTNLSRLDIPKELITLQRLNLILKRLKKEKLLC